jgi:hypothetical protein
MVGCKVLQACAMCLWCVTIASDDKAISSTLFTVAKCDVFVFINIC